MGTKIKGTKPMKTNEKIEEKKRVLRTRDAHKYLGIGRTTLWKYIKEGKLTPINLSKGIVVFEISELDSFIDDCKAGK